MITELRRAKFFEQSQEKCLVTPASVTITGSRTQGPVQPHTRVKLPAEGREGGGTALSHPEALVCSFHISNLNDPNTVRRRDRHSKAQER